MNKGSSLLEHLSEDAVRRLEDACCRFEQGWQTRQRPDLMHFLNGASGTERLVLLRELLRLEVFYRRQSGEAPSLKDYQTRFPDNAVVLEQVLGGDIKEPSPSPGTHETTDDAQRTGAYPHAPGNLPAASQAANLSGWSLPAAPLPCWRRSGRSLCCRGHRTAS